MISLIALAAATVIGVGIIAAFWDSVRSWILRAAEKVKQVVKGIVYGATVFIKKISEGIQEISKHYSKNGAQWEETVVTRTVSASEVPPEIRNKAQAYETDITDELQNQLAS